MTASKAASDHIDVSLFLSTWIIAKRSIVKTLRTPQIVFFRTMQSIAFLLIFRYVFGGAINTGTLSYVDFMVPGLLTVGLLFTGSAGALAVAEDLQQGVYDRFRSMPIPRAAIIIGRVLSDTFLTTWVLLVTTLIAFIVGFRIHGDLPSALLALSLGILFGFAFAWIFVVLGLFAANAQAASGFAFLILPVSFASSAYVPVETMPEWLQLFAEHQPITIMINTVRILTQGTEAEALLGHTAEYYVLRALIWTMVISSLSIWLAVIRFRRQ